VPDSENYGPCPLESKHSESYDKNTGGNDGWDADGNDGWDADGNI